MIRRAIMVDGANLYYTAAALRIDIDFKRLLSYFEKDARMIRANYYTAVKDGINTLVPLIDWLAYNRWRVVKKPIKEWIDDQGVTKVKGNMDIEMAVDAFEMVGKVDEIVLFSGDGDFTALVEALQRQGMKVVVVSSIKTEVSMIADELRRAADDFIDLADLEGIATPKAARIPKDKPSRSRYES